MASEGSPRVSAKKLPAADGGEGIDDVLDRRLLRVGGPGDRDDVEAGRVIEQAVRLEIRERRLRHSALFEIVDRFGRMAGIGGAARLHFDEDDGAAIDGDDVEFAKRRIEMRGRGCDSRGVSDSGRRHVSPRSPSDFGRRACRKPGAQAHEARSNSECNRRSQRHSTAKPNRLTVVSVRHRSAFRPATPGRDGVL